MRVETHFAAVETMSLTRAILIYESPSRAVATQHMVDLAGKTGLATIGAGAPLSKETVVEVARKMQGVSENRKRQLLAPNVLLADAALLLWWLPSARRRIQFNTGNKPFDAALNGREVLHPALLFAAAERGLSVFALGKSQRPTSSTRLFRAPYMNLYPTGGMCAGSFRLPDHVRVESIPTWEEAFFETHFSHSNITAVDLCHYPNGHNALWLAMLKTRATEFPAKHLAPMLGVDKQQVTVEKVMNT